MAMAEAPRPPTTQAAEPPHSPMNQLSLEDRNNTQAVVPHEGSKENAGALTVANHNASPVSPDGKTVAKISPGKRGSNLKAEAFAVAHSKRVEHEAHAYIDSEVRKAEAHAEKQKALAEKERMREEARAIENLKREEQRAEMVIHEAQLKADQIIAKGNEKAHLIKANAKELAEKDIAEATTRCESAKAAADEQKDKKMADIKDQAEIMLASGELIAHSQHKKASSLGKFMPCLSGVH